MKLDYFRRFFLPVAIGSFLTSLLRGATPGRLGLFGVSALAWYGLSRRKVLSLDRDRFAGGRFGRHD
jgi:hypothetical protein